MSLCLTGRIFKGTSTLPIGKHSLLHHNIANPISTWDFQNIHYLLNPMEFEKKIRQTRPFKNEWERAMVNILFTHAWLNDRMRDYMEQFGITRQQFNVLRILRGQHPKALSTHEIRTRMVDRAPDTSRIVDRMVQKELLVKELCVTDKRLVDVRISNKGLDLLKSIEHHAIKIEDSVKNLSEPEARQLNVLLDKLKE